MVQPAPPSGATAKAPAAHRRMVVWLAAAVMLLLLLALGIRQWRVALPSHATASPVLKDAALDAGGAKRRPFAFMPLSHKSLHAVGTRTTPTPGVHATPTRSAARAAPATRRPSPATAATAASAAAAATAKATTAKATTANTAAATAASAAAATDAAAKATTANTAQRAGSILPWGPWLPVPLSVRRAPPSALPSHCPQPGATPTHAPAAGVNEGVGGGDDDAADDGAAAAETGGSNSSSGGGDGDDYGDGGGGDASSLIPGANATGADGGEEDEEADGGAATDDFDVAGGEDEDPELTNGTLGGSGTGARRGHITTGARGRALSPSSSLSAAAAAAHSPRWDLARCERGSARCLKAPIPRSQWQPGRPRRAASGPAAAPRNAASRSAQATLLDHAFAALRCATCTPVYVGTECPPGDVLPATHNFTLELATRYEGYKTSPPHKRPAARAMMKYLGSTGCAFWRRGAFRTCASLIEGEFTTRAGLVALRWGFPWARFNVPAAAPVPLGHPVRGAGKPLCSVTRPADVGRGHSDDTTGLWVPHGCRLPYRFPHALLSRCLAGKRLLVTGDSLMRQFAGRFVATIRGQPLFAEHEIGPGSRYTWDIAGGRDEWVSAPSKEAHIRDAGDRLNFSTAEGAAFAASSFTLVRHGDVYLDDWESADAVVDALRPTHAVFGVNYWLTGADSASAAPRVVRALPRSLRPRPGTSALRSFVWYETPCYSAREFASTGHLTRGDWAVHEARNPQFRSELTRLWRPDRPAGLQNVSLGFLPNCALGRADVSSHVLDNTHLACRWHPFPQPGMTSAPITSIKATADFDCTNHLDLTGVRLLLASMCPEEFRGDGGAEWED